MYFNNELIQPFAKRIIWVYSKWQLDYDLITEQYSAIEFVQKWYDKLFSSISLEQQNILVLDNQIGVTSLSQSVADLFITISFHFNFFVINIMQNVNNQGKSQIIISNNSHFSVVLRNMQNASQCMYQGITDML